MRRPGQRGFTFIEMMIVVALAASVWLGALQAFERSDSLVSDARIRARAEQQHRRGLRAISIYLRAVDINTLTGFNGAGQATQPSMNRVTGSDLRGRTFGPVETIRWVTYGRDVDGVANAGALWVDDGTTTELLVDKVPQNGFMLTLQGGNLVVNLTTYWRTKDGAALTVTGSTTVSLRNKE